jgi:plasmid stability protein
MARKKTEPPKMPVAEEVRTKPVRLDLDPELHQKLRVVAAKHGKPMAVFARELVEKAVNAEYREGR